MKNIKYSIYILLGLSIFLCSCEDDSTGGVSNVTVFPDFVYNGDELMYIDLGEEYHEPGVTASIEGEEIPVTVSASGLYFGEKSINTSVPDIYDISYTTTNRDGFKNALSRTVIIVGQSDLVNSIEGIYTATTARNGELTADYTDMEYFFIKKSGENTYVLSDGIGGYYDLGRAYGPGYVAPNATVTANDISSNDFSFGPPFTVGIFGGEAEITSMEVDPVAKTIEFTTIWQADPETAYTFEVTLKQVEL